MTEAKKIAQELVNRLYDNITARDVRAAINRDGHIRNSSSISVTVEKGIVTLTGAVASAVEYVAAQEVARTTVGVVDIKDSLAIKEPELSRIIKVSNENYYPTLKSMATK